jgi:uncharacterized OB-fold protein
MPKVIPVPDAVSQPFWDAVHEQRLIVQHCAACDRLQYPPRATCTTCGAAEQLAWQEVNGRGHIAAAIVCLATARPVASSGRTTWHA